MAVEKVFWRDPYLTRIDATVTGVSGAEVTLDRTVAFAASGGQASDAGTIAGREIVSARNEGPEIVYTLQGDHGLAPGDVVTVAIDWPTRYRLMRLHLAAELVLELVTRDFPSAKKVGADISPQRARIDFAWDGSIAETFPLIEPELAQLVDADLAIESAFSDEPAQQRYWRIDGFAQVPCGGTHPRRTGEIGRLRLKRTNPGAGKERIEIRLAE